MFLRKGINVLSLFDGMSCGRIALDRSGIAVNTYHASEIDKHAITVSNDNYPDIIRHGDITKWREWDIDWSSIDLILAGSPCQGFSFAGKQLAFDDPRSALFFVFVDILNHVKSINPNVKFLLENVKMKKEFLQVITDHLNVEPININSNLITAQNRNRYYWCNWHVNQPDDLGINLVDILANGSELEDSLMSEGWFKWWDDNGEYQQSKGFSKVDPDKALCMVARQYANWNGTFVTLDLVKYFSDNPSNTVLKFRARNKKIVEIKRADLAPGAFRETRTELGKSVRKQARKAGLPDTTPRTPDYKKYVQSDHNKANCIVATRSFLDCIIDDQFILRALVPLECERLQTVPDNYTASVSNTQRYKMLGNGWTVDVIVHLLLSLYDPNDLTTLT